MSTPESDRSQRKAALKQARHKLALRKKQREELRAQRAARLGGKIDTSINISTSLTSHGSSSSNINKRTSILKQKSLLTFMDDFEDIKEEKSSSKVPNKASLLREPRSKSQLSMARLKHYNYTPISMIETWDKWTQTDFDMFSQYLIEEYSEEFGHDTSAINSEVKANLMLSKYKIGWPKELWIHEKSLSPSPHNLMYGDDEEYEEQQKKIKLLKQQEKERKDRQKLLIKQRRKQRLERKNRKILPEKEYDLLVNTGKFLDNFRKKTKWIERTLGINATHFISSNTKGNDTITSASAVDDDDDMKTMDDYEDEKYNESDDKNFKTNVKKKRARKSKKKKAHPNLLKFAHKFQTEETAQRAVCDINFCHSNTDWFLASYFRENIDSTTFYNDGFVLVWNLILPSFPEYKLYSESMITSTQFHPMDEFIIYCATVSGQILCYDLRNGSACKPVQRTSFSDGQSHGHSSPIYAMDFLQSAGVSKTSKADRDRKRHILSISNDGKLCIFKDDGIAEKAMHEGVLQINDSHTVTISGDTGQNVSGLNYSGSSSSQELSTTCFAYQYKHTDTLLFGSDSGKLYCTDIHNNTNKNSSSSSSALNDNTADENAIFVQQCIDAHAGPITNISFPIYHLHQAQNNLKYPQSISGLYLTSSYDWTVKLWHADYLQCIETYTTQNDYVYDVKWLNDGKPGVFVCCDGDQKLNLFDLKYDFKQPINTIQVKTDHEYDALTKLNWGNNGKYLCSGDSNGNIYLYLTNHTLLNPQQNDFDNFDKAITQTMKSRAIKQKGK